MEESSRIRFSLVVKKEAYYRFQQIADVKGQLKYWTKGNNERFFCDIISFNDESLEWEVMLKVSHDLPEKVYFTFHVNGQDFFGRTVAVRTSEPLRWRLKIVDNLYKSEKRLASRVLVFPHHLVDLEFLNPIVEGQKSGGILSFGRKNPGTQTNLMLKFMELVGQSNSHSDSSLKVRVIDISSTGLALKAGRGTKDFFAPGSYFENCRIHFNDQIYEPVGLEVVYRTHHTNDAFIGSEYYRIGMNYNVVGIQLKEKLEQHVMKLLTQDDKTLAFELFKSS